MVFLATPYGDAPVASIVAMSRSPRESVPTAVLAAGAAAVFWTGASAVDWITGSQGGLWPAPGEGLLQRGLGTLGIIAAVLAARGFRTVRTSEMQAESENPMGAGESGDWVREEVARLADAVPHIVWSARPDGSLFYCNRHGMARLGVTDVANLAGYRWEDRIHPDDLPRVATLWKQAVTKSRPYRNEQRLWIAPESGYRWHLVEANPVLGDDGAVQRFYGISTDIHALRLAEDERSLLQRQLHAAQKLEVIGKLTGGVAHDFNNNLTAILGGLDLAMHEIHGEGEHEKGVLDALKMVEQGAQHAAALTRQLLSFGRRQIHLPRPTDPIETIRGMDFLLRRLVRPEIVLSVEIPDRLPPILIDPTELEQVVLNLVINAVDAMPEGGSLRIRASAIDDDPTMPVFRLSVEDTGVGMDEATLKRIFEPFFTTKAADRGTGLGLPTVQEIVGRADAALSVESTPGEGTEFRIDFPGLPDTVMTPPQGGLDPISRADALETSVLVCDDDPNVLRTVTKILTGAGCQVIATTSSKDLCAQASDPEEQIVAVLLDIMIPGTSGVEVARALHSSRPGLPVVFMSGYPPASLPHEVTLTEGVNFLRKPFTRKQLLGIVNQSLGRSTTA